MYHVLLPGFLGLLLISTLEKSQLSPAVNCIHVVSCKISVIELIAMTVDVNYVSLQL